MEGRSFVSLLTQGIIANDAEKINEVVKVTAKNKDSLDSTVAALDVTKVPSLLKIIHRVFQEEYLSKESKYLTSLHEWINFLHAVLLNHSGYLVSLENLDEHLGGLIEYANARTSNIAKLLELEGQLSFAYEQAHRRSNPVNILKQEAEMVFEDGDSDIDNQKDLEELANKSDSDDAELFGDDDDADDGGDVEDEDGDEEMEED